MKLHLLILILTLAVAGCADQAVTRRLEAVEATLDSDPAAALATLDSINPDRESDRALHALLTTQARYKNYIDDTDDSLINYAVIYYENHPTSERLMNCYFLKGIVQTNSGDLASAVINLKKSLQIAKDQNDNYYIGVITRAIANIYTIIFDFAQQKHYLLISHDAFRKFNDTSYIYHSALSLGTAYNNNRDYPKAITIADSLIPAAINNEDTILLVEAYRLRATSNVGIKNHDLAINDYNAIESISPDELTPNDIHNLIFSYYSIGQNVTADSLIKRHKPAYISSEIPHYVMAEHGDYKRAYNLLLAECNELDSALRISSRQTITRAVNDYAEYESLLKEEQFKKSNVIKTSIIIICCLIIIIGWLFFKNRIKSLKQIRESLMEEASDLLEKLSESQKLKESETEWAARATAKAELSNKLLCELFGKSFHTLDRICATYYEHQDSPRIQKRITDELSVMIKNLSSDPESITALENAVNKYRDNLASRFKSYFPNMTDKDIRLYLYCVCGFSAKTISLIIGEKLSVVYNRKSRLKAKISASDVIDKDVFIEAMQ